MSATITRIGNEQAPETTWAWAIDHFAIRRKRTLTERGLRDLTTYVFPAIAEAFISMGISDPTTVTAQDVEAHLTAFAAAPTKRGTPPSSQTQRHRYNHLSLLFKVLVADEIMATNPLDSVEPPEIRTGHVAVVRTKDEIKAVLATTKRRNARRTTYENTRDRAILAFLYGSGCRLGGVASLTVDNLRLRKQEAVVTEKGSYVREVVFGDTAAEALHDWLRMRKARPGVTNVFTTRTGKPLTEMNISRMVRRRFAEAGLHGYSAHAIRRGWATQMAKKLNAAGNDGGRLAFKQLGGWRSWQMAERYVHWGAGDFDAVKGLTPDNDL